MKLQEETLKQTDNCEKVDIEWLKCKKSAHYFLSKYAFIQDRTTAQTVKWQPWEFQLDLLDILLEYKEILILKARQLGVSWLLAGYSLWKSLFSESARCLLLSQGERDAWKLLAKNQFIWQQLPSHLKIVQKHEDSRELLDFEANDSEIEALPSTEKAGRGVDATLVVRDELAKHPFAQKNFVAIGPAVDAGGQLIDLSTIDKFDEDNHFTERVNKAFDGAERIDYPSGLVLFKKPNTRLVLIFLGWKLRPVREEGLTLEEWFKTNVIPKYDPIDIEQEYPETIEEALSTPQTVCRFDIECLNDMLLDCHNPIREERNGLVKIYREPVVNRKYTFPIDPSEGMDDPSAGLIIDWQTDECVALFHGKISIEEQARICLDLNERYNEPFIAPERNAGGLALILRLTDNKITKFYFSDKKREKHGWHTNSATRPVMLAELAEMVRLRQPRIPNKEAISEFKSFVRTAKNPDGIAVGGRHDEFVILWAIHFQVKKYMPMPAGRVRSYPIKEAF